jgi:hypothetical protein
METEIEQKFKDLIKKNFHVFNQILRSGFNDELDFTSDFAVRLKSLGHSIITNNLMIYNALQYADANNSFVMYKIGATDYFCLKDDSQNIEVHGKILKLKKSLISFVNDTQQSLNFLSNEPIQYEMQFMPERINIILGYLPNEARTDIEIYITRPTDEKHLAWVMLVPPPAEEEDRNRTTTPKPDIISPNNYTLVKRVRPITQKQRVRQNE